MSTRQAQWASKIRLKAVTSLGGKCKHCGETDWRVLEIDHKEANGIEERKVFCVTTIFQRIIKDKLYRKKFQILCADCHRIKTRKEDPNLKVINREKGVTQLKELVKILKPLMPGK